MARLHRGVFIYEAHELIIMSIGLLALASTTYVPFADEYGTTWGRVLFHTFNLACLVFTTYNFAYRRGLAKGVQVMDAMDAMDGRQR